MRLWDVASGECKYTLTCHTCSDLKFDAIQVITASFDNTLGRWEWSTGNCLTTYRGHMGAGRVKHVYMELGAYPFALSTLTGRLYHSQQAGVPQYSSSIHISHNLE